MSAKLVQLGRDETAEFVGLFDDALDQLYTWDSWAVAYSRPKITGVDGSAGSPPNAGSARQRASPQSMAKVWTT